VEGRHSSDLNKYVKVFEESVGNYLKNINENIRKIAIDKIFNAP
jgi:hypothetical protein